MYWKGFYQSLRPTQMGLSLNIGTHSTFTFYFYAWFCMSLLNGLTWAIKHAVFQVKANVFHLHCLVFTLQIYLLELFSNPLKFWIIFVSTLTKIWLGSDCLTKIVLRYFLSAYLTENWSFRRLTLEFSHFGTFLWIKEIFNYWEPNYDSKSFLCSTLHYLMSLVLYYRWKEL